MGSELSGTKEGSFHLRRLTVAKSGGTNSGRLPGVGRVAPSSSETGKDEGQTVGRS